MGKDVKKKFTVSLDIDTKDAEKQVKASAENIKQILSGAIKDGVGVKELRNIADAINSIFEGIGQMPPLDIDKNFKGNGSAEKRIELLTKALENLGTVIDQIKIGSGGNSGDLSKDIQSKIDKLQKQKQELQEVIDVINNPEGTSVKLSGKNEEQLEQLKAIKDEYVKAREAKQQFEKSNMTNTSKYLEAVGRYARASAMIKSAFQSEDLTDEGIDFAGTGENLNILAESETFIANFHKNFATRIGQMKTIFSDFITNINTELGKIQKSDQPSKSSAYDELKKKLQEYYELKLKLKNVEEDPAEYNNLQDRQRAIQDEIYAMKELSEESENAFYDLFDSIDAEDNLQLNDAITQFCNILKVDIPNGADQAVSAATSAFAKIAQEADKASESAQKVMYHLGNLLSGKGQARDTFGDMAENLTTNAIGTQYEKYGFGALGGGLFGVIDPSTISQEPGKSNFIQSIDISKYNMYMADTEERAIALIDFLSKLQKFSMKSAEPNYAGFDAYLQGIDINSLYDQFKVVFEQSDLTKEKFQEFINEMVVLLKQAGLTFDAKTGELNFTNISKELAGSENISTRFMKMLGFEGVNTGITSLGGLGQGSVLFDFNKVDIVGYFDSVKSAIQDYERIVQQTDGKEWVGTTEQLQQYANNIDVIIDKMQQYKNSGVLKDTSELDETLNKLTQIRENISDILSGKNISGNSPFEMITTGPDKTINSIQEAESKLQEFLSLADEINKKSFDVYGDAEDNVEIGKYTERLTTAKAALDELGDQGLLTAEQLNQVQEAFNRANSNLDLSTSHYNGYGNRYYDYSYYDEYKEQQNRADDLEAQKRDLENELARKEERITELESDLRASDGASEQILDEKYELQVENENLKEALSHREMSDDELEVLRQENSALEEKLELLQNIAEQYANTVTPKNREKYEELNQKDMDSGLTSKQEERFWELGEAIDLADQQLEEFGETYDKIILKLSNGKKIEILPDDAGLRKFDKIANEYYQGEYNGFEIEDVIFMRKQEQAAIEQNNQKLERQLDIQEQIATAQKETPESQQAETIANNAKAITSWEELCQVVERYNEIVLKAKTEGQTLTNEDEAELSRINDRFAATKGVAGDPNKFVDYAMAMSRISGILGEYNPNRLAEYFGIEIPQAAAKATDAIQEVAQATEDSSAPPDTSASTAKYEAEIQVIKRQNDELERNQQLKVQEGALDTNSSVVGDMSQESKQLDELHAKLVAVKEAVDAKTQAFEEEYVAVNAAVAAEIESLNKLKLLLDNIQNLLQITFASTKQSFGDINLSQDQSGTNKTVSGILQSIQGTLEQIYGVLTGFTGVESDNKNSLKYKEPVADAPAKTSDVYDALVNKLPSEIATEGTLSTIKESVQQLVNLYKPKEDDKSNEGSNTQETLSKLVITLTASVKTLQDVANGIVDHQKTQQTNKSVAMAKIANPIQYKQVVDIATSSVGQLGSEVQVKGLQALADGAIKVEGAFKDANGAWQGFTVKVNEANQAVDLATDKQSSFAKSLNNASDTLTQQNAKLNGVTKQANELYKSLKINPLDTSDSATAVKDVYSKLLETLDVYKKKKDALTDDELNGLQQIYAQLMKNAQAYAALNEGTNKKIQKAYGSNIMQNRIAQRNTLTTKVSADTALSGSSVMASAMKEYDDAWNRLNVLYTKLKNTPNPAEDDKIAFKEASAECNNLGKEVEKLLKSYAKMHNDSNVVGETPLENYANRANELQDYVEATYGAKAVIGDFKNNYNELEFTIDNGNGTFTKAKVAVDNLRTSLVETAGDTQTVTSKWGQFVNDLKGKFRSISTYLISMTGFQEVWQQIRQGIQYVREIDSALTELKKVTDETDTTYRNFLQTMSQSASVVGSTTSELTQSAADWARLGYSIEQAGELAKNTAILMNVSEFDNVNEATEALISSLQAFGYEASNSIEIVDKLNIVGNNFAISSDGIASGLQRSASTLVAAGNSLEQSIAMLAAGNKVIQDPETLGNALKVLSMRIRGVKSDLEDAGEETDGMIENTSKLRDKVKALTNVNGNGGVDILTESGAFRSTYDILLDIAKVWDQINEADPQNQAALLEILAGKTRGSQVAAILQNPKDLEAAYATAMNSAGSAMAENEKYLDSIQGRIDLFTNSLQTMWMNFINSDALKFIIDLGTAIIKFTDSMGLIPTAVGAFTIFKTTASDIKKSFDELSKSPEKVLNIFKTTAEDAAEAKEIQAEATIQAAEANQIEGQMSFFSAEANQQEANSTNASTISKAAETVETIKNTAATKANIAITKALNVVKSMGKGLLIGLAVSAATSLIGKLISSISEASKRMEELTDNAIKSADEIDSTRKSVEEYKNSIEELRAKLADSTISEQEAYDARAQLIDIQNQLIDKFGLEAKGINLVTGAIEDQISAIDELQRKSAEDWLADNNEAYQNAIKEMNKTDSNNDFIVSSESGTITRTTDQYGQVIENREITSQTLGSVSDEIRDAYNKGLKKIIEDAGGEIKESLNSGVYGGTNYYNKNFTASFENKTVEELDAVFRDMQSFLIQFQKDNGVDLNARITQLEQLRKDIVDEDYTDARELYNKGRQQEAVATYGTEYGAILDAQEKFYNSTNDEDRLAAIKEYERAIATAEQAATDAGQEHMQDFFAEMHNKFSKEEFELKIKTDEDGLKTKLEGIVKAGGESGLAALDDNQIKDMISKGLTNPEYHAGIYTNTYGYTQAQVKGLVNLQAAADTAGISVEDLISVLVNLGLIAGRPAEKAAESVEAVGQAYSILTASAEKYASINDILNELIYDNIAISEEQYDALKDLIGSEEEFADCIDTSNGYVVKNTSLLKKLVTEKKKAQAADVKLAKSQARLEYYKLVKQLNSTLNSTKDLNKETREAVYATLDQIDAVDQAIYKYQLLEDSLLGATNAFEEFAKAQELDALNTYGDSYVEMAQTMYDAFYKTGQVGTEAFWAATEALVPRIEYAGLESDAEKIKAIFDYFRKSIAPTLQLDEDKFSINYKAIEEFIEDGLSVGVFKGNTTEFDLVEGMNLEKAAELMGMTKAQAYALFAELDKYNFSSDEPSFLSQLDDSLEGRIMRITSNLEELNKQKLALLEDGGYEKNKEAIDGINTEIQKTTTELNKAGKEAYDMWKQYTENEAALASLEAIEDKQTQLTKEQATTWGVEWDEEKGLTVQQAYDMLLEKKTKLEEPTVMTAELAIENIFSQIGQLERLLQNYDQLTTIALKFDISEEELKEKINTRISQLKEDAASMAATFGIDLNEEDQQTIEEQLESIEEIEIHDKRFKVVATGLSSTLNQVRELLRLSKELADMDTPSTSGSESTGFYVSNGYHPTGSGGRTMKYADGTFHIPNSAFADGSVGAPKTETALVGELGPEMLVRNGRWTTIGEDGAEFTQVKKGDIIFNHEQTKSLLKNGYITSRGKAFASGTAYGAPWPPVSPDKSLSNDPGNNLSDKDNNSGDDELKDEFEEYFDWIEVKLEEINDSINLNGAKLENAVGASAQNAIIDDMIAGNEELYSTLTTAADKYYAHAEKLLAEVPAEYRAAAKNGKIAIEEFTGDVGEEALNAIQEYREWVQKGDDATQQAEETLAEIRSLAKQAFDNIATDYENQRSLRDNRTDQLESSNALSEAKYGSESTKIYEALIKNNKDNIALLKEQRNAMQANLNAQVRSGDIKKYSQDWYDAVNSIAAVDNEIIELTADTYDYIDAMGEIHWDNLDNVLSRFEAISNEVENLLDILDNKDMVDEAGNWTDEGITSLGLYAQQMEIAEVQAKKYQDEIAYLNKNWKSLGLTEQEYVEKLDELKSGQYDSIKAYHEAKNAIVDLNKTRVDAIKNGIEKEIDAYEELIQKKKEALDADKDLYDFEKSVNEQQKNIATIERKLAALATDNSTSAAAQRKKLEEELLEAKGELEDTFYERSIQNQQNALDKELENFQNSKEEEMEGWDEYLENTEQVVSDSLATIQANTDVVYQTLKSMGQEYGLTIAETLTSPWRDGEAAIQSYAEQFGLSMSSTVEELQKLAIEYEKIMKEIEGFGEEVINRVEQNAQSYVSANNSSSKDNKPSSPSKDTMPSRTPTEQQEETKSITVGGKINAGSARIYANSDGGGGSKQYFSSDPIYVVLGEQNGYLKVRHHSVSSGVTGWFKKSDVKAYAKGTTGVPSDQIAWLDELGEELVMHADGNGRLAFLSKGTSVIPANLTKNLMKLGELNPQDILDRSRPIISAPHIVNNEISIDMSFGSVVNVEHVDNDTLPDLAKTVEQQMDKYMKKLNSEIRKYAR